MSKRMLIDATHKEETRVAITYGNKLIEYDYESQNRKPLKGSIFLAKVTRVEPSLQAAFVNFGGNRHGFLPFSEIHPDYFRIPVADREALEAEQEALLQEHDDAEAEDEVDADNDLGVDEVVEEEPSEPDVVGGNIESVDNKVAGDVVIKDAADDIKSSKKIPVSKKSIKIEEIKDSADNDVKVEDSSAEKDKDNKLEGISDGGDADAVESPQDAEPADSEERKKTGRGRGYRGRGRNNKRSSYRNRNVEVVGGEELDPQQRFRFNLRRKYKIQEVIKRGQIMLVQANKEERGNKGAAVGSYLSLPGRYCVLMPNSPRAGGVSRKIANGKDRARMRDIVKSLEVPKGMSVIMRTAGVSRTKAEIKRDLDYLMRLWDNIRELTLESTAPALVYEEADLIKRSVRDLYTRDVEEIYVAGEDGFNTAKDFMKMMIPSHVKKVKHYGSGQLPLFNRYQIESQINEIGETEVRLKSGGYLVINPTEALVSVDVNSGKSTKGRHIEETALKTNLEAADEVARQLKLRDLGGLVVIDFIDMEHRGNNAKVERRMKDALSSDRARVQVGRISSFGLMELSRQRLSPSLTEAQFTQCNNCNGLGLVRTDDAMSIIVLRAIEEEGLRGRAAQIIVQVTSSVALYILNYKRRKLAQIEERYNLEVLLRVDDEIPASEYRIEVSKPSEDTDKSDKKDIASPVSTSSVNADEVEAEAEAEGSSDNDAVSKTRRRGRRGGRGRNNHNDTPVNKSSNAVDNKSSDADGNVAPVPVLESNDADGNIVGEKPKPKPKRVVRGKNKENTVSKTESSSPSDVSSSPANDDIVKEEKPKKAAVRRKTAVKKKAEVSVSESKQKVEKKVKKETPIDVEEPSIASQHETVNKAPKQKKKGWWNRL